jgi:hypothetical protein
MKTTKRDVQAAIGELNARIPLAVAMQQEVERVAALLQAEKAAIRELLDEAGATAWPCAGGQGRTMEEVRDYACIAAFALFMGLCLAVFNGLLPGMMPW